jgi:hypothetical protein
MIRMDKQKASKLLAILAPIILITVAAIGIKFPQTGLWLIGGTIIVMALVASRLKR